VPSVVNRLRKDEKCCDDFEKIHQRRENRKSGVVLPQVAKAEQESKEAELVRHGKPDTVAAESLVQFRVMVANVPVNGNGECELHADCDERVPAERILGKRDHLTRIRLKFCAFKDASFGPNPA
jgi:hypothetical protein